MFQRTETQGIGEYPNHHRIHYVSRHNTTEYNLFLIYAKENESLKHKLDLFLKSLLKYTSISIHLHVITDDSSQTSLESSINTMFHRYKTPNVRHMYTIYDVQDARHKIKDIHENLMPLFSYSSGSLFIVF